MNAIETLNRLKALDIAIYKNDNDLKLKAPPNRVNRDLLENIRKNKKELLHLLSETPTALSMPQPIAEQEDYPITDQQKAIWVLSQNEKGNLAYNMPLVLQLEPSIDLTFLRIACQTLVKRHETLRTRFFKNSTGEIRQQITNKEVEVSVLNASSFSKEELDQNIEIEGMTPFQLDKAPLVRFKLLQAEQGSTYLLVTIHHLVCDGLSLQILQRDLLSAYQRLRRSQTAFSEETKLAYKDYTAWTIDNQKNKTWQSQLNFWKQQLEGELPKLRLNSTPRPLVKTFTGQRFSVDLKSSLKEQLESFCQSQQVTLFTGVLAGLNILLHKYSGENELIVGTATSGRNHPAWEQQVGLFINTLPLRTTIDVTRSFREHLTLQKTIVDDALDHQDVSFGQIVDELHLERDFSRSLVFDLMLVFNVLKSEKQQAQKVEGIQVLKKDLRQTSQYDMVISFNHTPDKCLSVDIEFNSDIYTEAFIQNFIQHYESLLSNLLTQPDASIQSTSFITAKEEQRILKVFNDTTTVYPNQNDTLVTLFKKQVEVQGTSKAITFKDRSYSFQELDQLSDQLGNYLSQCYSCSLEAIIGVELVKSEWMMIAILAIQKLGCAYLPIDPNYPEERKKYITEDSGMIGCIDATVLTQFFTEKDQYNYPLTVHPELKNNNLAYVIYTSGSTGNPKGCMLEHRGVVNRIEWMWRRLGYNSTDVILQKTTFTFDVSVWEIFLPLCWGCQMVICDEEDIRIPSRITDLIHEHQVTCLHFVPSMLDAFIGAEFKDEKPLTALSSLKRVITSGEALKAHTLRNWYRQLEVNIYNLYGPTEASIDVTIYDTKQPFLGSVPIGQPIANTKIYILDEAGNLLPPGVNGELYLGGVQVARGYLNNEQLTQERFVPNPFESGQKMYKTGDIGRWLLDGNIEYVKRMDSQIKIRGYRVELGEIEHAINELENIASALVQIWEDPRGNKQLVAYTVSPQAIDRLTLKQALKRKLPDYMIPAFWVALDELPLTSNGKINRKALPVPVPAQDGATVVYEKPQTFHEIQIAKVFQQVLNLEKVDRNSSFFEMGGDSISVIELATQLKAHFQVALSVADLYQHTSVAEISEHLANSATSRPTNDQYTSLYKDWQVWETELPSTLVSGEKIIAAYPMNSIQKGMVFGTLAAEAQGVYHDQFVYPLHLPDFDLDRFKNAFSLLVRKHEILRTAFNFSDVGEAVQLLAERVTIDIPFQDIQHLDTIQQQQRIQDYLQNERNRSFDFSQAPLWRVHLFQRSSNDIIYVLQFHHSILDGWSIAMLNRELSDTYDALVNDPDYVPRMLDSTPKMAAAEATLERQKEQHTDFWSTYLANYKRLDIFEETLTKEVIHQTYTSEVLQQLNQLAQREQTTIKTLFFAAFTYALQILNQELELTLGLVSNTRPLIPDGDKLLGCFLNTIPVRVTISEEKMTWRQYIQLIDHELKTTKRFDRTPLLDIKGILGDHSKHGNPFFDVLFNFINFRVYEQEESELLNGYQTEIEQAIESHELTNSALVFDVNTTGGQLNLTYTLAQNLKYGVQLKEIHCFVDRVLQCFLTDVRQWAVSDELLPSTTQTQLLESFSPSTDTQTFESETLLDLFAKQVQACPHNNALESVRGGMTYLMLDQLSDRLAFDLLQRGIGEGAIVGLCLERSEELLVSILAILKSGAAYLPIDPKYPEERIRYMLEQSGSQLIISNSQSKLWKKLGQSVLWIDLSSLTDHPSESPIVLPKIKGDTVAYLMYTSGSTGRPKGIQITHAALNNYINFASQTYLANTDGKGMGLYSSISFDLTVTSLFTPLATGKTLYLFPENWEVDELLKTYLDERSGLEVIKLTPSHVDLIPALDIKNSAIKIAIVGGAQLYPRHIAILKNLNKELIIYNEYGPTESTVGCIVSKILSDNANIHIGRPIVNTSAYILNASGGLAPVGIPGELYLGGAQLAIGYYGNPEATAARFVPHLYAKEEGAVLYRTGDLAKWLPDGNMVYLGRVDDQVKIRGHRVELGEIEQVLEEAEQIKQVLVTMRGKQDSKFLVAYFTSEKQVVIASLRDQLSAILPNYMVPAYMVQLDDFPLTVNGKIAKDKLPDPLELDWRDVGYLAPRRIEEQILAEAYQQVLKRAPIGVNDNFFDLGGDSIKAIFLINQVKQSGYELKVSDVLKSPVIEELALRVQKYQHVIAQEAVTGSVALTPMQQWFFNAASNPNHFNQSLMLRSTQLIDIDLLRESFQSLIEHHDALRMRFQATDNNWQQFNEDINGLHFELQLIDLRQELNWELSLNEKCDALQASIDIQQGPLFKGVLFQLPTESRLLLIAHHLVIDGVSWRIVLEDLATVYEQLSNQQKVKLPLKSDSFQHWVRVQTQYAKGTTLGKDLTYWQEIEAEAKNIMPISKDQNYKEVLVENQVDLLLELDTATTQQLLTQSHRAYRTETNDVLLAALGLAIYRVFGNEEVILWMEGHGRDELLDNLDVSRTVGWLTSLYPVRLPQVQSDAAVQYLITTKENLRAIPNKGISYGVLRYLRPNANLNGLNASLTFNYLGDLGTKSEVPNHEERFIYTTAYRGQEVASNYSLDTPLSMTGMVVNGKLQFHLSYDTTVFAESKIQEFSEAYQFVLEDLITTLCQRKQVELTPSDLTYKGLSLVNLQMLQKEEALEDVYALSPLQEGMYYHWMLDPNGATYVEQTAYRVEGKLQEEWLKSSYGFLVDRHAILRTCFSHEYGQINLQIVKKEAMTPFNYIDARGEKDVEQYIVDFKKAKYQEGFNLNRTVPMNLAVIQIDDGAFEFIWTYHHILMDGWCASVLIDEFAAIYQSMAQGQLPELPPVTPYVNYINWLAKLDQEKSGAYWEKQLSDLTAITSIPFGQTSAVTKPQYDFRETISIIAPDILQAIKKQCRMLGITEYTFLKGAWAFLLSRYNNTQEVVFGNVVSGRPADLSGVERMIGLFINMIPVRIDYEVEDKVSDFLRKVQEQYIESIPYHQVPLSDIQAKSELKNELFDHGFVYLNYPRDLGFSAQKEAATTNSLKMVSFDITSQPNYDFNIIVMPKGEAIEIAFWYNGHTYTTSDVARIGEHFQNVIKTFSQSLDVLLTSIDYLSDKEHQTLLYDFNATQRTFPDHQTVLSIFNEQVVQHTDAKALVQAGESLTYGELDRASNQLANYLIAQGMTNGQAVPICLERSSQLIISQLAIVKAGGIYVPIDPAYPEERIQYILDNSNSHWVITKGVYQPLFAKVMDRPIIWLDIDQALIASASEAPVALANTICPTDPLYIIYTSGSTGWPKGVSVAHRSLINLIDWHMERYMVGAGSKSTVMAGVGFDASALEIWSGLLSGSCLYIVDDEMRLDQEQLLAFYHSHAITHAFVPPALIPDLVALPQPPDLALQYILIGGDRLPGIDTSKITYALVNQYGPTEATVMVTDYIIASSTNPEQAPPIGKPIANTQLYILDANQNLTGIGVPGELYIGGMPLALGYYNNETETNLRFVAHPFDSQSSALLYRTGDIAKWLPNGNIEYIGRADQQIKIRGHRIELGEIEQALYRMEDVANAIVTVYHQDGSAQLAAYFTSETKLSVTQLRHSLKEVLPKYMLPAHLIQLDEFPLTANGKVARHRLPDPLEMDLDREVTYVAPRTKKEQILTDVYQDVLKWKQVSIHDNFFDLGGDSIKAILLINRLKQRGYTVKAGDVLEYPIITDLVSRLELVKQQAQQQAIIGEVPLAPIQHWFFKTVCPYHHYNQSVLLTSSKAVDESILKKCFATLVVHHDALRMRFKQNDEQWEQWNEAEDGMHFELNTYDLTKEENWEAIYRAHCNEVQASFKISEGPLCKIVLFRLPTEDRILLVIHHLVVDGVSWRILLEDLSTLYGQLSKQQNPALAPKSDSYQLWTQAQQTFVTEKALLADLKYWQAVEAMAKNIAPLPADQLVKERRVKDYQDINFELSDALTKALMVSVHRVFKTNVNEVLLAGLGQAVKLVFGNEQLLIQLEGHGREDLLEPIEIGRTVGWFTSVYPVLLPSVAESKPSEYLIEVKEHLRSIPRKGMSYQQLRYLHPDANLNGVEAAVTFNYLGDFGLAPQTADGLQLFSFSDAYRGVEVNQENIADTAFSVTAWSVNGRLKISIGYHREEYAQSTVQILANHFQEQLETLIQQLLVSSEGQITPSDLTYKGLTLAEVRTLSRQGEIEDVYDMSPLQEGIYYHWLMNRQSAVYVNQTSYTIQANLEESLVEASYRQLLQNHAILRTWFTHEYDETHLQVVMKEGKTKFNYIDLRGQVNQLEYIENQKTIDRNNGFDLHTTTPMQLSLIRQKDQEYNFIWTHHHILMDGWCASLLINEFYQIYQALHQGHTLPIVRQQNYSDYIKWLSRVDKEASLTYWRNYLVDYETMATIPFINHRSETEKYEPQVNTLRIEGDLFQQFRKVCQNFNITESHLVQACWAYLLSSYNHQQDVVFGTVVSGRPGELKGVEEMVGLFINTIPVRINYEATTSVQDFVLCIKKQAIESVPHHYLKLSDLQAQSDLNNQLFDHVMVVDNYFVQDKSAVTQSTDTQQMEILSIETIVEEHYDFVLVVVPRKEVISFDFKYNSAKIKDEDIQRLQLHFYNVLQGMVQLLTTNSTVPISSLSYLSLQEKEGILYQFNQTAQRIPPKHTILDLVQKQVALHPEKIALRFGEKVLSYQKLDEQSNQLANYLIQHYPSKNTLVPVCMYRSIDLVVVLLGLLKAGKAYVPIDPSYPKDRVTYILDEVGATLCITDATMQRQKLAKIETTTACFEFSLDRISEMPTDHPAITVNWKQLAYMIYTSGSTGHPKGVAINHQNLANYLDYVLNNYFDDSEQQLGLFSPLSFDFTVTSLWGTLACGGLLYIYPQEMEIGNILQHYLAANHHFTAIKLTPAHVQLINALDISSTTIRRTILGGEQLYPQQVQTLLDLNPEMEIHNEYGPTEATVGVTVATISGATPERVHIGRPIDNTEIYLLDAQGHLVPIGVKGELYIGGLQLASGYYNQPELTAAAFVDHPFVSGERLYKTGDLGMWLADGNIQYLGRKDTQVKIRGYRIELGEIERVLMTHQGVRNVYVTIEEGREKEASLLTYVVLDQSIDTLELQEYLLEKLPAYMVPPVINVLEEFPLTANGKIDRKQLVTQNMTKQVVHQAPETELQIHLCELWKTVLRLETIPGLHDNFFELGGHSIKVIKMLSAVYKKYGVTVGMDTMFKTTTVFELARYIENITWFNSDTSTSDEELEQLEI